jgi:hypothetical protein
MTTKEKLMSLSGVAMRVPPLEVYLIVRTSISLVSATTVLGADDRPVAAVEVAAPAIAYTIKELVENFGSVVRKTAAQISAALGH